MICFQVIFNTKIYHANFSSSGAVCINILKDGWVSGMTVDKLLVSIRSLMADANPNDPLVPSIAAQFTQDRMKHDTIARKWVEAYAKKYVTSALQHLTISFLYTFISLDTSLTMLFSCRKD
ncbi:hypothetical protein ONE63_011406 [Megalurothrips usitatus]|uniref:UBC core domain-containing protein n=1 Tax=Megalurothrips usitatus TaxID=439358 RepID=A0AAV7WZD5_9NEOP|nr:hypothetical protein ONE63_011406 [Megalurothrips usitatus]